MGNRHRNVFLDDSFTAETEKSNKLYLIVYNDGIFIDSFHDYGGDWFMVDLPCPQLSIDSFPRFSNDIFFSECADFYSNGDIRPGNFAKE